MDALILYLITGLIGVMFVICGWQFVRMVNKTDTAIDLLESVTKQTDDFLEEKIDKLKDKMETENKRIEKDFWTQVDKIKENHSNAYNGLREDLHKMNTDIISEIRKLEQSFQKSK